MEFSSSSYIHPDSDFQPQPLLTIKSILDLEKRSFAHYSDRANMEEGIRLINDPFLSNIEPILFNNRIVNTLRYYYAGSPLSFFAQFFCSDFRSSPVFWHGVLLDRIVIVARKAMSTYNRQSKGSPVSPAISVTYSYIKQITDDFFPKGTGFILLAHMQPDSFRLFNVLFDTKSPSRQMRFIKLSSLLSLIEPEKIMSNKDTEEAVTGNNFFWFHTK